MTRTDARNARTRAFGRQVRPLAFWLGFLTCVVVASIVASVAFGQLLNGVWGDVIGAVGAVSVAASFCGFWARRDSWMTVGLLLATGFWAAVWAVVMLDSGPWSVSGWIAFGLAGLAGWAWWIEVGDE